MAERIRLTSSIAAGGPRPPRSPPRPVLGPRRPARWIGAGSESWGAARSQLNWRAEAEIESDRIAVPAPQGGDDRGRQVAARLGPVRGGGPGLRLRPAASGAGR